MTGDTKTCSHADVGVTVSSITSWYFDFPFLTAWDAMREYDLTHCQHARADRGGRILATASVAFEGRNDITKTYLEHKDYRRSDYLLQIDADMGDWPADALCQLIATAKAYDAHIVSGLAFAGGRTVCFPTIYERVRDDRGVPAIQPVEDIPKTVTKAGGTGGAFLLASREALTKIGEVFSRTPDGYPNPHPWYQHTVYKGNNYGEDTTFCMRAATCGFDVYIDPRIETTHWKHIPLSREMYESGGRLNWAPHPAWPNDRAAQRRRERAKQ